MEVIITNRVLKKTLIGLIYLTIFSFFIFIGAKIFFQYWTPQIKVSDIAQLEVVDKKIINKGGGIYNFIIQVKNPNTDFGASKIKYSIFAYGKSNELIEERQGVGFLMPSEIKYFFVLNWYSKESIERIEAKVDSVIWAKFDKNYYNWLPVRGLKARFSQPPEIGYLYADGILKNDSPYFLKNIAIKVVLKDKKGKIIAINKTSLYDVKAKESRYFKVIWNNPFYGVKKEDIDLFNVEVYPEANFIIAQEQNKLF